MTDTGETTKAVPARRVAVVPDDAGELRDWAAELVERAHSPISAKWLGDSSREATPAAR